ncbi:MAG TPA: ABC transporter permease [Stellaceae bacterium]|nr:ABC transporter permease [Stellaceae bacterium]
MAADVTAAQGARPARGRRRGAPGVVELGLLSLGGFAAFFGLWFVVARSGVVPARFLPAPGVVAATFFHLTHDPFAGYTLQQHLLSSIGRFLMGFALAAAAGVPLGLLMGWFRWLDDVVSPVFEGFRFIAPIAWVPFAALWFGTGIGGPILIIFSGAFPPCVINAQRGARLIEPHLIEAARSLGAGHCRMFAEVLVPGALPSIVAGLRISAGLAWQSLVGAELIVVSSGVGYLMVQGQSNLATPIVMSGMIAIGIVGFLIDVALRAAEARIRRGWAGA